MRIKICGLFQKEDIEYVNSAKPDYIGFVFAQSRRQIPLKQAVFFKKMLLPEIKTVGVFQNQPFEFVRECVLSGAVDFVQLHGAEDNLFCEKVKNLKIPVIKVLFPPFIENGYAAPDYFLLDSGAGTGVSFDWNKIPSLSKPFFLAGGISLDNIEKAKKISPAPFAIDVSSGVEINGIKNKDRILGMVSTAKE